MKKILAITMTLALLLSVSLVTPAMASIPTNVNVTSGAGAAPIIQAKWETPDADLDKAGTQIEAPGVFNTTVDVTFWAIVTHPSGKGNIDKVYVDVYYPDLKSGQRNGHEWCGQKKYQLELTKVDKYGSDLQPAEGVLAFEAAAANPAGIITWGPNPLTNAPYTYDEVKHELEQCYNDVYKVTGILHYHQPAGMYNVVIKAVSKTNVSSTLSNLMEYLPLSMIEADFTSVNYGDVTVCNEKLLPGDANFGTTGFPTVRNIGNTDVKVTVQQTDLMDSDGNLLGKTGEEWMVEYGARLGNEVMGNTRVNGFPGDVLVLPDILGPCSTEKLDLWVHIKKAGTEGALTGTMTVGLQTIPFLSCGPA